MLTLNKNYMYIKCSKYEYLIKKGSISDYSYNLIDEKKIGILDTLVDSDQYPIEKDELVAKLSIGHDDSIHEEISNILDEFIEIEVLLEESTPVDNKICVITKDKYRNVIQSKYNEVGFSPHFILSTFEEDGEQKQAKKKTVTYITSHKEDTLKDLLVDYDIVNVIWDHYSPSLFRQLNTLCLSMNKKLVLSYFDGDEGVLVPLMDMGRNACYNDFEMMRESSFYNLLDYHTMKEYLIKNPDQEAQVPHLYLDSLVNHTAILLKRLLTYKHLNAFAFSFDFERMVVSKTRLMKFPKCPSCQGDKNIKHPFI